jgi:hypothetical protein
MRILLLNQFFYPDSAATSQLLTDLARWLASQGHSVRVLRIREFRPTGERPVTRRAVNSAIS